MRLVWEVKESVRQRQRRRKEKKEEVMRENKRLPEI